MENDCEGCVTYTLYGHNECNDTETELCPCRNCLVKVMCGWACDDLMSHWTKHRCPYK